MKQVEVEGGELAIRNEKGDIAIVPTYHRDMVKKWIKDGNSRKINDLIDTLPMESDYANAGGNYPILQIGHNYKDVDPRVAPEDRKVVIAKEKPPVESLKKTKVEPKKETDPKKPLINVGPDYKSVDPRVDKNENTDSPTVPGLDPKKIEANKKLFDLSLDNTKLEYDEPVFPKDKEEVKKIQKELVERGHYNLDLDSPEKVKELQKLLSKKGYSMRHSIKPDGTMDGIYGDGTKKDYKDYLMRTEVDGIAGTKTKEAYRKLDRMFSGQETGATIEMNRSRSILQPKHEHLRGTEVDYQSYVYPDMNFVLPEGKTMKMKTGFKVHGSDICEESGECATFTNNKVRTAIGKEKANALGIAGDAWELWDNVSQKGGKEVFFSGYKKGKDAAQTKTNIKNSTKNRPKAEMFKPGQYVEIYNPTSGMFQKAYNEGSKTATTHIGIVVEDENGNLFVEHNIATDSSHKKGRVHRQPVDDFVKGRGMYKATRIFEPDYKSALGLNEEGETSYIPMDELGIKFNGVSKGDVIAGQRAYNYQRTIVQNKEVLKKNYALDDNKFRIVNKAAFAVAMKESYFGYKMDPTSNLTPEGVKANQKYAVPLIKVADNMNLLQGSEGIIRAKDHWNLSDEYLEKTGLKKAVDSGMGVDKVPEAAMVATSILAARTRYLDDVLAEKKITLSEDEYLALLVTSYNQGFKNIEKDFDNYKKTGDRKYIEQYKDFSYGKLALEQTNEYLTFQ